MEVLKTALEGVFILEPIVHGDERGYFIETFSQRDFDREFALPYLGHPLCFVQDNESKSGRGVLRGLHFQRPPHAQAKLVSCVQGRVLDVVVDIRKGSPTYMGYLCVELSGDSHRQLFIPKGFAHGYLTLSESAIFHYKCDEYYHPESEGGINILDPSLGIEFPDEQFIMSSKDRNWEGIGNSGIIFTYRDEN